jgi:hypothetical protein
LRPVEVDLAEPAPFGDKRCKGGGWLVDDLCLIAGGDGVVKGVRAGDLVGLWGFDDGLPKERIDWVRVGCDASPAWAIWSAF